MKIEKNQLYTTEEVADTLKVSAITVKRYISKDKIASIKFNGIRRIKGEELLKIIEENNGYFHKRTAKQMHVKN